LEDPIRSARLSLVSERVRRHLFLTFFSIQRQVLVSEREENCSRKSQRECKWNYSTSIQEGQAWESITDLKIWLILFITICSAIPNGGLSNFSAMIIK